MSEHRRKGERTMALTVLGAVLFLGPLLRVFDAGPDATLAGIPVLYVYLFGAWALLIALLGLVIERSGSGEQGRR